MIDYVKGIASKTSKTKNLNRGGGTRPDQQEKDRTDEQKSSSRRREMEPNQQNSSRRREMEPVQQKEDEVEQS